MYKAFEVKYTRDVESHGEGASAPPSAPAGYKLEEFFARYGGTSFNEGLYRVLTAETSRLATDFIATGFPNNAGKAAGFAMDWLGRLFCLDQQRRANGELAVLMLEPGTGQALEVPANLLTFHEDELVNYADASLAPDFYQSWLAQGGAAPQNNQCIGYRKLLFLGGADTVENLELSDLAVYWSISAQLIHKVRGLPPGTRIKNISIS